MTSPATEAHGCGEGPVPGPSGCRPTVLFVCVHNAGRSQMAAGYLREMAGDRILVLSAGSQPADQVNPAAVAVMAEAGIDLTGEQPQLLSEAAVSRADVVVTMGCGDACPFFPGRRYEDWVLDDPAGQDVDTVRGIRDQIQRRVQTLIDELLPGLDACIAAGRPAVSRQRAGHRDRPVG